MPRANDRQVGGRHYKTELEHWDLMDEWGVSYLEGCATAYITRCRKKGKRDEDLGKAEHFVEKRIERHQQTGRPAAAHVPDAMVRLFVAANNLTELEGMTVALLLQWRDAADLDRALRLVRRLQSEPDA